jgi:hypothetical protein
MKTVCSDRANHVIERDANSQFQFTFAHNSSDRRTARALYEVNGLDSDDVAVMDLRESS